jgi:hypothetical protein
MILYLKIFGGSMLRYDKMFYMKQCVRWLLWITIGLTFLVGCAEAQPTLSPIETSMPSPLATPSQATSPVSTPVLEEPAIAGPKFAFDALTAGATTITGQGPAGIPIIIVDVSLTGEVRGDGFIDSEGNFDIALSMPLITGHRMGIMAGTTTAMTPEEIQHYVQQLRHWMGDHAMNLPHVGLLFETAMVE